MGFQNTAQQAQARRVLLALLAREIGGSAADVRETAAEAVILSWLDGVIPRQRPEIPPELPPPVIYGMGALGVLLHLEEIGYIDHSALDRWLWINLKAARKGSSPVAASRLTPDIQEGCVTMEDAMNKIFYKMRGLPEVLFKELLKRLKAMPPEGPGSGADPDRANPG